jgi:hypothetical protein
MFPTVTLLALVLTSAGAAWQNNAPGIETLRARAQLSLMLRRITGR